MHEDNVMRVRNLKSGGAVKHDYTFAPLFFKKTGPSPNYNLLLERRVEQLWLQSRSLGWSYPDFVAHLTEVLIVLRHRSGVKRDPERQTGRD
jgi:hypothetical protein